MSTESKGPSGFFVLAIILLVVLVPLGGLLFMWGANATFHDWLGVTDRISFGQACGAMLLLWLVSITVKSKAD